ncbi:MAG: 1-acyl-sn-glycerol-3-phosphate acyltransferase [bacterium]|nr:1-acyl-sn-glycerol-3-phosphate acyltransferase [bacterium]
MRLFYATVATVARTLFRTLYGVRVTGAERLPRTGAILICSNHRSNLDPPLIGSLLQREVHYFAKAELFRTAFSNWFLGKLNAFPVKRGQFDKAAMTVCLKVLKSNEALVFFPEGTRAPANGFLAPKFGVGWVLAKTRATVVPLYLHGTSDAKAFHGPRPQLELVIGDPVPAEQILADSPDSKEGYQMIADRILDLIRDTSRRTTVAAIDTPQPIYDRDIISDERLR